MKSDFEASKSFSGTTGLYSGAPFLAWVSAVCYIGGRGQKNAAGFFWIKKQYDITKNELFFAPPRQRDKTKQRRRSSNRRSQMGQARGGRGLKKHRTAPGEEEDEEEGNVIAHENEQTKKRCTRLAAI